VSRGVAAESLIVFAPVEADAIERLRDALAALADDGDPTGASSPFARVPGTHFARFAIVPALTGPNDVRYDQLGPFLLMCADFDSTVSEWVQAVCTKAGEALGPVLHCWTGFPGLADPSAVTAFFESHNVPAGFTVKTHRSATVGEIREALRIKRELRALAIRAQAERLTPTELRDAWQDVVRP
jgi:hypothetical protein